MEKNTDFNEDKRQEMQLETAVSDATRHLETVEALAILYSTIMEVDLLTHLSRVVKSTHLETTPTTEEGDDFDKVADMVIQGYIHPETKDEMYAFMDLNTLPDRLQNTDTVSTEYKSTGGVWFKARFIVKKRDEAGRAIMVLYAARNITEEKEQEIRYLEQKEEAAAEAERANISKTNFLRRMSHDIRTPLNGILGMLKIMDDNEGDKEKYREYMDKIKLSAEYLRGLVNNVLDISKMETGVIELENKPFDLMELLLNTIPIIETYASQNSVVFSGVKDAIHIEHKYVIGSPVHLNRILMNIASNAIKYNRSGGTLDVYGNEISCDGEKATYEFICVDTGLGMSEEFQKHAFDPFTQEGKPTTTTFSGSGLGLAIVKKITDQMGGTIELQSEEGVGTTIRIVIPFMLDPDPEISHKEEETLDLTGYNALLVEDNDINMEIAKIMLEGLGLSVTVAQNGQEALDAFKAAEPYTYDFIFMDMMMPVMGGLDATRAIRKLDREDAKNVPIIAMTANAFVEDRQACFDAGMNDHVGKPVDHRDLARTLVKTCRDSEEYLSHGRRK